MIAADLPPVREPGALEHARTPVRLAHVRPLAGRLAATMAEYRAMLACADPAGTRRWGP